MKFSGLFRKVYPKRQAPFPYQQRLAEESEFKQVLAVPTGMGKTDAAIGAWAYRRFFHPDESVRRKTPLRLLFTLPMRTLTRQVYGVAGHWVQSIQALATESFAPEEAAKLNVHLLLGGEVDNDWERRPERPKVIIGTQDMVLSRMLNRAYGESRYRWPMSFGLVNNDTMIVLDETQLIGVGTSTAAQLQGFRDALSTYGPTRTLWMSATLEESELDTVDHRRPEGGFSTERLNKDDLQCEFIRKRLTASKPVSALDLRLDHETDKSYAKELARRILEEHRPGTLTLGILNTVARAQAVFNELEKLKGKDESGPELLLIHGRFREGDRKEIDSKLFDGSDESADRIVIATQAVEAGVDISATTLFTELAIWPSLVQRFGRCNRRGECDEKGNADARVFWIDLATVDAKGKPTPKYALPYAPALLDDARELVQSLKNVSPEVVDAVEYSPPYKPRHIIRRKDIQELWDTTPDLTGNDLDVSRFIRDSQDCDVKFFWRDWEIDGDSVIPDPEMPQVNREELCAVAVGQAKDFVKKLRKNDKPFLFRWNPLDNAWRAVNADDVRPGQILLLHTSCGGYDANLGWTGDTKHIPTPLTPGKPRRADEDSDNGDPRSHSKTFLSLERHTCLVVDQMQGLAESLKDAYPDIDWEMMERAARWHDCGKSHEAFQNALLDGSREKEKEAGTPLGKVPLNGRIPEYFVYDEAGDAESPEKIKRPHFRHELAGAVAYLLNHASSPTSGKSNDLIAYLIAAHHGKVRASLRSLPKENRPPDGERLFARGVWDGDRLPETDLGGGEVMPKTEINLSLMQIGDGEQGPSWISRVLSLRDDTSLGPFRLAMLETLLRLADWRGSEKGDEEDE